jgi:hypothetical protein
MRTATPSYAIITREDEIEAAWHVHTRYHADRAQHLTPWRRNAMAEAQNWRCCWAFWGCTAVMVPEQGRPNSATFEHIIPLARGGDHDIGNVAIACADCNVRRGHILQRFQPATAKNGGDA